MENTANNKVRKKWYKSNWFIILMLIFIAPVGIFLVWKYATWSKVWKIVTTVAAAIFFTYAVVSAANAPPTLSVDNAKNGRIETQDASYKITGSITGADASTTLTVNGTSTPINSGKYAAIVELKEGDNTVTIAATKKDKVVQEYVIIHRLTAAEIQARKDAEAAKQKAEQEAAAKSKAEAEAAAATKKAADDKKAVEDAAAADKKAADDAAAAKAAADKKAAQEAAKNAPKTSFGDGTYLVNKDIQAGTYKTNGTGGSCYYERRSDTSGSFEGIIANDNATGPVVVTIAASDVAFKSQGCGTWNRQ